MPSATASDASLSPLPAYFSSRLRNRVEWSQALPATALAGLIAAVLMMTRLQGFGLGALIGGSLAVVFYRRRIPLARITAGMGVRLGMVSGILGGAIFAAVLSLRILVFHSGDSIREQLIEGVQQAAARNPDPQALQAMEFFKSPQGLVLLLTMGALVTFVIFSGLGGVLGALLLRRKDPS